MLEQDELCHLIYFCWIQGKLLKSSSFMLHCMQLSLTKRGICTVLPLRVHITVFIQCYNSRRTCLPCLIFCSISTSRKGEGCASPTQPFIVWHTINTWNSMVTLTQVFSGPANPKVATKETVVSLAGLYLDKTQRQEYYSEVTRKQIKVLF